ncbi:UNVERIFIED_CONTAM: hypothetical protein K2H54_000062 [Gekko kuhli]
MWQNNLERQRKDDERYRDETAYARERDSKHDERQARRDGLYEEQRRSRLASAMWTPATGKSIKNKELASIMVTQDGAGVVLGVKVTYDDGSTALRPVTNNRTAKGDDEPKVIPIADFIGTGYKRAALSREMMANANNIRTSLGLTPGADVKGYRQAVVKLQADTEKAIGQNPP